MSFRRLIAAAFVAIVPVAGCRRASRRGAGPARCAAPPAVRTPAHRAAGRSGASPSRTPWRSPAAGRCARSRAFPACGSGRRTPKPPNDPRLIYVRISPVSLADPEKTVANIRANDAKQPWSAPLVEVREVGGIRGVLVRMDSGEGDAARSTLALKLPLEGVAVDFVAIRRRAPSSRSSCPSTRDPLLGAPAGREGELEMPLVPFEGRCPRWAPGSSWRPAPT